MSEAGGQGALRDRAGSGCSDQTQLGRSSETAPAVRTRAPIAVTPLSMANSPIGTSPGPSLPALLLRPKAELDLAPPEHVI